jgi:hypothetical protein
MHAQILTAQHSGVHEVNCGVMIISKKFALSVCYCKISRHFLKGLRHVMNFVKAYRIRSVLYVPMQLVFLKKIYDCLVNLRKYRFKGTVKTEVGRNWYQLIHFCRQVDTITRGA